MEFAPPTGLNRGAPGLTLLPMRLLVLLTLLAGAVPGADWGPVQFLMGRWIGEGTGQPGTGSGGFSFATDLQGAVLVRKNYAEYPAANGNPGFRHDDLTIIYRDESSHQLRAVYFDNEGHRIEYAVQPNGNGVVFTSEGPRTTIRYRFTYTRDGPDRLKIKFEIAEPGKDLAPYIEATAHRDTAGPAQ